MHEEEKMSWTKEKPNTIGNDRRRREEKKKKQKKKNTYNSFDSILVLS